VDSRIAANWWAIAVRGLVAVLFGIVCLFLTGATLVVLIAFLAAYLLIDGVFAIVAGARSGSWLLGLEGALGIVAGALAFFYPGITALVLALLIAAWAIVTGIVEIAAAIGLRRVISNEWVLIVGGVLSIVFGVLIAVFPGAGLVAIIWLIGIYAILWGAVLLGLALRLRGRRPSMVPA
jgi:uncharacterized membrane protein HdeD (DUF308 family)